MMNRFFSWVRNLAAKTDHTHAADNTRTRETLAYAAGVLHAALDARSGYRQVLTAKEAKHLLALLTWPPQQCGDCGREFQSLGCPFCDSGYEKGHRDGWDVAHEPAPCGHARANWKDPKYSTPEYEGEERCEFCDALENEEPKDGE